MFGALSKKISGTGFGKRFTQKLLFYARFVVKKDLHIQWNVMKFGFTSKKYLLNGLVHFNLFVRHVTK